MTEFSYTLEQTLRKIEILAEDLNRENPRNIVRSGELLDQIRACCYRIEILGFTLPENRIFADLIQRN